MGCGTGNSVQEAASQQPGAQQHPQGLLQVGGHSWILLLCNSDHIQTQLQRHPSGVRGSVRPVGTGDREIPWLAQQHHGIHHTTLPCSAALRLLQSAWRWFKSRFVFTTPRRMSQLPVLVLLSGVIHLPAHPQLSPKHSRVVPSCLQASLSDISASSFQAERGR